MVYSVVVSGKEKWDKLYPSSQASAPNVEQIVPGLKSVRNQVVELDQTDLFPKSTNDTPMLRNRFKVTAHRFTGPKLITLHACFPPLTPDRTAEG